MPSITSHCPGHTHTPPGPAVPVRLTPRELQVLTWVAMGKTSWEIGKIIVCKECTVNFHCRNIIEKLDARNRGHALAKAKDLGLFAP